MSKPGFMLYHDDYHAMEALDDASFRQVIAAMVRYSEAGEITEDLDQIGRIVFGIMRHSLDRDDQRYQRRVEAGRKGGVRSAEARRVRRQAAEEQAQEKAGEEQGGEAEGRAEEQADAARAEADAYWAGADEEAGQADDEADDAEADAEACWAGADDAEAGAGAYWANADEDAARAEADAYWAGADAPRTEADAEAYWADAAWAEADRSSVKQGEANEASRSSVKQGEANRSIRTNTNPNANTNPNSNPSSNANPSSNSLSRTDRAAHGERRPPTVDEVREYARRLRLAIDAGEFVRVNEARGWTDSYGNPIRSWQMWLTRYPRLRRGETDGESSVQANSAGQRDEYGGLFV